MSLTIENVEAMKGICGVTSNPNTTKQQTPVESAFEQVDSGLTRLLNLIDILEERVKPCLIPAPDCASNDKQLEAQSESELVNAIRIIARKMEAQANRIATITDRIQL